MAVVWIAEQQVHHRVHTQYSGQCEEGISHQPLVISCMVQHRFNQKYQLGDAQNHQRVEKRHTIDSIVEKSTQPQRIVIEEGLEKVGETVSQQDNEGLLACDGHEYRDLHHTQGLCQCLLHRRAGPEVLQDDAIGGDRANEAYQAHDECIDIWSRRNNTD